MKTMTKCIILALVLPMVACTVSSTGKKQDDAKSTDTTNLTEVTAPSAAMLALLNKQCETRPEEMRVSGSINGTNYDYTEVLVEQDQGSSISGDATNLGVLNINGAIYVEPSSDGDVHWGARKWVLAKTKEDASKAMSDIKITSEIDAEKSATVLVDHPSEYFPKPRYEVCVVVQAPATWLHQIQNDSGSITSVNHEAKLAIRIDSGDTEIVSHGSGSIEVESNSGIVDITTTSAVENISVSNDSGDITVDDEGDGSLDLSTSSGVITAYANSLSEMTLSADSGIIDMFLGGTGEVLSADSSITADSGSISITLDAAASLILKAEVSSGIIDAPSASGDDTYNKTLNGGTVTLTMSAESGIISIDY